MYKAGHKLFKSILFDH